MKTATLWRSLGAFLPAIFLLITTTVSAQAPGTAYESAAPATATASSEYWTPLNGPAANAIDGDYTTSWNSATFRVSDITVTFASPRVFSGLFITAHAGPAETMHYTITATRSDNATVVVEADFYIKNYLDGVTSQEFDLGQGFVEYTSVQIAIDQGANSWKAINEVELIVPVAPVNTAPDVSAAVSNPGSLWPPNKKMVDIAIDGIVDAEGDEVTITIDAITNDETGTDDASFDGSTARVRADRFGKGDGRTYTIEFTADDGQGGSTTGSVTVEVPHDQSGKSKSKGSSKPAAAAVELQSWGQIKTNR